MALEKELAGYFAGALQTFTIPLQLKGTPFQESVWTGLQAIPYGLTWSYRSLSIHIKRESAHRAVANANGRNPLAIIIPCHRVIHSGGGLGGYAGGVERKQWLLDHEASQVNNNSLFMER